MANKTMFVFLTMLAVSSTAYGEERRARINTCNFESELPPDPGEVHNQSNIALVEHKGSTTTAEELARLDKLGLRPAKLKHFITERGSQKLVETKEGCVVLLWQEPKNDARNIRAIRFHSSRPLYLEWCGEKWDFGPEFSITAVRK